MNLFKSKNGLARSAGIFYVLFAITGVFSFYVESKIFADDPLTTANNILSSEYLFRLGIVSEMLMATCWILVAVFLYGLFRNVNKTLAILMVGSVLTSGAIIFIKDAQHLGALLVMKNSTGYLAGFESSQLNALVMLYLDIAKHSMYANFIFFGLWLFPFAYLILKSGFFPKTISKIWCTLVLIAGLAHIIDFLTYFLFPDLHFDLAKRTFPADLFSTFWLLFKGVKSSSDN